MRARSRDKRLATALRLAALFCVAVVHESLAQTPTQETGASPSQTPTEVIGKERAEKLAQRGLKEGLDTGKGSNGPQITLGGMRAAQGMSSGVGYRRSDLFRDHLGYRATARGTLQGAFMLTRCTSAAAAGRGTRVRRDGCIRLPPSRSSDSGEAARR